jgi:galactokinase
MDDLVAKLRNAIGYEGGANMTGRGFGGAPLIMVKRPRPGVTNL